MHPLLARQLRKAFRGAVPAELAAREANARIFARIVWREIPRMRAASR